MHRAQTREQGEQPDRRLVRRAQAGEVRPERIGCDSRWLRLGEKGREPGVKVTVERRLGQEVEPGRQEDQLLGALGLGHALLDHAETLPQAQAVAGAAGARGRELEPGSPPTPRKKTASAPRTPSSSTAAAGKLGQLVGSPISRCQSRPTFSSYSRNSSAKAVARRGWRGPARAGPA